MGAGNHPRDDAEDPLGEARFYLSGEVLRVDARGEVASACISRNARRQESGGGEARIAPEQKAIGTRLFERYRTWVDPTPASSAALASKAAAQTAPSPS